MKEELEQNEKTQKSYNQILANKVNEVCEKSQNLVTLLS